MNSNQNKKLNSSQKQAVEHKTGPLLIIAGAGTGKTTVITERVKYLISQKKIKPEQILALTFTEKAAQEMLSRLDVVMPLGYEEPWLMTFHGFCDRILRDEGLEIGLSTDYQILDQPSQWILFKKHLFEFGFDYYLPLSNPTKFIGAALKLFSRLQDEDITPENFLIYVKKFRGSSKLKAPRPRRGEAEGGQSSKIDEEKRLSELARAYQKYQEIKLKENQLDFGDLILWTLKLFRERPAILKKYQNQFVHVLVDEFQDTNWAQLQLIKLLAPAKNKPNLVVVGDDDQSIYKWRGAAVSNILDFKKHYPRAQEVVLTRNYRSGQKLLNASYKLISNNNPDRLEIKLKIDKRLIAQRGQKLPAPRVYELATLEDEADFVVGQILDIAAGQNYTYKDFAILARANNHLDPFVFALRRYGLPYQLVGNRGLFDQEEIRDLIFFTKAVVEPTDSRNLFQLLQMSILEISPTKILALLSQTKAVRKPLWEIIQTKTSEDKKLDFLVKQIQKAQALVAQKKLTSQILLGFIHDSGLVKKLVIQESLENQLKIKNINLFFTKIKKFEMENKGAGIVEFVDWLDLLLEAGENPGQAMIEDIDTVSLLTVHAAKGLEFNVVFVVNCVNERFPTRKRGDPIEFPQDLIKETLPEGDSHLEEERRLFYVACTRARDYLLLTYGKDYGGARPKKPSLFLEELKIESESGKASSQQLSWLLAPQQIQTRPHKVIAANVFLPYISYSQIDTFLTCPLKYKYRYILQVPTKPSAALTFGLSVHQTLRDFHALERRGQQLEEETLLSLYEHYFDELGYESEEHKNKTKQKGKILLKDYFQNLKEKLPGKPYHLEKSFRLQINGIPLIGKIDRIDKVGQRFELIDYKTGSAKKQNQVDKDRQLTIYAMASRWSLGIDPEKLSLYFLEGNLKLSTQRTEETLKEEREKLREIIEKIKISKFEATPGFPSPCGWCDYNLICPFAKKA